MGKYSTPELRHQPFEIRFWAKIKVLGPDDCWEWQASKSHDYGRINRDGHLQASHRVAYELTYGPIPEGLHICHKCNNPPCCNPRHLYAGTQADNIHDAMRVNHLHRFEYRHGEDNLQHRLTDEQVIAIKSQYREGETNISQLSRNYGVSRPVIKGIVTGRFWKHLP